MDEAEFNRAKAAAVALIIAKPKPIGFALRKNPSFIPGTKSWLGSTQSTWIEKPPREGTRWGKNWLKDPSVRKGRSLAYQVERQLINTTTFGLRNR
jgi:hypothetical protein